MNLKTYQKTQSKINDIEKNILKAIDNICGDYDEISTAEVNAALIRILSDNNKKEIEYHSNR